MKKKFFTVAVSAVLFASCFMSGCTWNNYGEIIVYDQIKNTKDYTEVSFFGYKSGKDNLSAIEDTLRAFMRENEKINVVYEGANEDVYWEALHRRHEHDVFDDIFMVNHDSMVELTQPTNKEEICRLENLASCINLDDFLPLVREQITGDDPSTVYFVPMNISSHNLYINYDVLEKHGKSVPTSYAEFEEVCDYFVKEAHITPIIVNDTTSLRVLMTARSMFEVYQSDTDAKIKSFNSNPEALATQYETGIDMVAKMIADGWIDEEEALTVSQTEGDLELFKQNERPFMITNSWATMRVKEEKPDLNYGVHPFFIPEYESVLVIDMRTCVAVNAASANKVEAKQLISYMTHPGALKEYCKSQSSYLPTNDENDPVDATLNPSNDYLYNGKNVIGSDYRLTIHEWDDCLEKCGKMLARGSSADSVKSYLKTELVKKAGAV